MTSDMNELYESENGELTIDIYESKTDFLLMITIKCRKFSFTKYPENIVVTLEDFQKSDSLQEYFKLEDYFGFIQRRKDGYRIYLEMVNSDLTDDDLDGITNAIRNYYQDQAS